MSLPAAIAAGLYESGRVPISASGWMPEQPLPDWPALEGDLDTDVAVVGAGVAGSSVALHLAERGVQVTLLEAAQPGDGASGRNAGHVLPFVFSLKPLAHWPDRGRRLLDALVAGRRIVYELCERHGIEADALRSGILQASRRGLGAAGRIALSARQRGYDVELLERGALRELLGTDVYAHGIHWRDGGRINPYLYTRGLAATAARLGAQVYGDSPVQGCEREGGRWRLRTPQGSARAARVVLCTNGHAGNDFFPGLGRTHYPLLACALATRPLPAQLLAVFNPARVALEELPAALCPMVLDGRNRLVTATIPWPGRAHDAELYFRYFLRYLHRRFPVTREFGIEPEAYWTGTTCSSSSTYHEDYPKLYRVAEGVIALMALGTWGNLTGSLLGANVAEALAEDRPERFLLPLEEPLEVRRQWLMHFKIRRLLIPAARVLDALDFV